jgi:hypothetical protein
MDDHDRRSQQQQAGAVMAELRPPLFPERLILHADVLELAEHGAEILFHKVENLKETEKRLAEIRPNCASWPLADHFCSLLMRVVGARINCNNTSADQWAASAGALTPAFMLMVRMSEK